MTATKTAHAPRLITQVLIAAKCIWQRMDSDARRKHDSFEDFHQSIWVEIARTFSKGYRGSRLDLERSGGAIQKWLQNRVKFYVRRNAWLATARPKVAAMVEADIIFSMDQGSYFAEREFRLVA